MNNSNIKIYPFLKWAGGKRQLLDEIKLRMPKNFNAYFEPFIGGGALFFELQPSNAYIGDINKELIHAYKIIRNNPNDIIKMIQNYDEHFNTKESYYLLREKYNQKILSNEYDVELAAIFIYLNKRCFNGLYRVNSKGEFNVPYNNKKNIKSISIDNIFNIAKLLKHTTIYNNDFETILLNAKKGDFVFLDSPYDLISSTSFDSYTKDKFSINDHKRLAKLFKKLDEIGCYVILTNHNTKLINELYKEFRIETISVKRMINSDSKNRIGEEVIITNFNYAK